MSSSSWRPPDELPEGGVRREAARQVCVRKQGAARRSAVPPRPHPGGPALAVAQSRQGQPQASAILGQAGGESSVCTPDGHCFAHASVQIRRRESRSSSSRATGPQPGAPCTRARTCFVHKVLVEVQRVDCEQHQPESNSRPRPERLLPVGRDDGERVPPRHDELHHLKRVGAPLPRQLRHVLLGR